MAVTVELGVTTVVVAVMGDIPNLVVVNGKALPGGAFEPERFRTLQDNARHLVASQTGLTLRYVEQLYTFADRYRRGDELTGGPRAVGVGYLALVREAPLTGPQTPEWRAWYDYFPWEDWREGRPRLLDDVIRPALTEWVEEATDEAARAQRQERFVAAFGVDSADDWPTERVLERYELLYEAELVAEAAQDSALRRAVGMDDNDPRLAVIAPASLGQPLALDSRRVLATALGRLRGKLRYRPIVFELLPPAFTLYQLQQVVEALNGQRLHKQNFRRLMVAGGLVEATGQVATHTGGRPAELYRFRRDVMRDRTSARAVADEER